MRGLIVSTNPPVPAVLTDPEVNAIFIDGAPPLGTRPSTASAGTGSSVTVKALPPAADLPTTNDGLAPGTVWNNAGFVCVVPGGGVMATSNDGLAPQTLWDNGGFVCVA